jgi:hypothetical protein|tara:strand:+ start:250 stop:480 length:231 start_codon:yes stop_codon:yes gene_type:complete
MDLYKLLKPEFKKILNSNCRKYDSAKRIKYVLLSKTSWSDLTITEFKNLMLWTDISTGNLSVHDLLYGDKIIKQRW